MGAAGRRSDSNWKAGLYLVYLVQAGCDCATGLDDGLSLESYKTRGDDEMMPVSFKSRGDDEMMR